MAVDDVSSVNEETTVEIEILANDSDVDDAIADMIVSITKGPSNGSVVLRSDNIVEYTPSKDFNGEDTIEYQICDPGGLCDTAVVTVTVNAVNDAPIAEDDSAETSEGTAVTVEILANDTDVDDAIADLVVTITTDPSNGSVVLNLNNTVEYTPSGGFLGEDTFEYELCDPEGLCDTATVFITVGAVNDGDIKAGSKPPSSTEAPTGPDPTDPLETQNGEPRMGDKCLLDNVPDLDLTCVADHITINSITASEPSSCIIGQTILVTLEASITFASDAVTDPFWYIATDGGDALEGDCVSSHFTSGTDYTFTGDTTSISYEDNSCGDLVMTGGSTTTTVKLLVAQEIPCIDANEDNSVDVSVCFAWNNGTPGTCGIPGSEESCACAAHDIPNLTVNMDEKKIKACR